MNFFACFINEVFLAYAGPDLSHGQNSAPLYQPGMDKPIPGLVNGNLHKF